MNKNYKYMVSTLCNTYNQSRYINDTLRGFAMQQTTFPCVYVVMDDASTDGEPEILRQWAKDNLILDVNAGGCCEYLAFGERMVGYLKNNRQSLFVIILLSENHYGKKSKHPYCSEWHDNAKYRALCEGDDFWIVPNKLQIQIDFLEKNPEYILSYTDAGVVNEEGKRLLMNKPYHYSGECLEKLISHENFIVNATVCYRTTVIPDWAEFRSQIPFKLMMGDKPRWLFFAVKGLFHYVDKETSSYRLTQNSASHSKDINKIMQFHRNSEQITLYYNNYFNVGVDEKKLKRYFSRIRLRKALPYPMKDVFRIAKKELKENTILILDFKLLILLFLRFLGVRK